MNRHLLLMLAITTVPVFPNSVAAHPGGGVGAGLGVGGPPPSVTMGPPAGVTMGPPAAAMAHIPNGVPLARPVVPQGAAAKAGVTIGSGVSGSATAGISTTADADPSIANAAAELGKLNAAHASPIAQQHASPKSVVGAIAVYKSATVAAQAAVTKYTASVNQDNATVTAAQVTLTNAQNALTALQNSGTATAQQLTDAQTAVNNAQAALNTANSQLEYDQASLSAAQASIVSAQNTLAASTNKALTPSVIAQLNVLLGI